MCRCQLDAYNGAQMTQKTPPIIHAIKRGDSDLATRLIHGKHYGHIDEQGYNNDGAALYWACCRGFIDVVHLLIMHCADTRLTTAWGATTLHAAADNGHAAIVRLLLRMGADQNAQTRLGDTSCHMAAYRDHAAVLQVLAEAGADLNLRNNRGRTALMTAEMRKNTKAMKYLRALADLDKDDSHHHDLSYATLDPTTLDSASHLPLHDVSAQESEPTARKHCTPRPHRNTSNLFHNTGNGKQSGYKTAVSGSQTPVKAENIYVPGSSRTEQLKAQVYSKNLETSLLKR